MNLTGPLPDPAGLRPGIGRAMNDEDMNLTGQAPRSSGRPQEPRLLPAVTCHMPISSYGRRNRQAIAARETRVATRLRAVQHAYQAVAGHDTAFTPPEPARTLRPPMHATDKEIELE